MNRCHAVLGIVCLSLCYCSEPVEEPKPVATEPVTPVEPEEPVKPEPVKPVEPVDAPVEVTLMIFTNTHTHTHTCMLTPATEDKWHPDSAHHVRQGMYCDSLPPHSFTHTHRHRGHRGREVRSVRNVPLVGRWCTSWRDWRRTKWSITRLASSVSFAKRP